jgi:iron complex transport system substrate-binding protein
MNVLRRRVPPLLICSLILFFSSAASQHPSAQKTAQPARIISLVPAVTEMLFALGLGERVVAVSSFDRFPPEVERLPRVGALLDPDVERILSLRPDLVIVYHSQKELLTQLGRAGISPFIYAHAGLADVTTTIRQLADRTGVPERGAQVAGGIERRIAAIKARMRDTPRPRTLVVFGREPLSLRGIYASGGVGFVNDMLDAAGGQNVFADVARQSVQATTELVIARRPDVILELRADPIDSTMEAKEMLVWTPLSAVPAVKNKRVRIIVDPRTVIPGPRVAEGVEALAQALHGAK